MQLYRCIDSLTPITGSESKLSLIVGYTIARSLLDFNPAVYGREPRSFKEVWAVYQGLVEASKGLSPETVINLIARLKEDVNGRLTQSITEPSLGNKESNLLALLVSVAKGKSVPIEELLREVGSRVSKSTMQQGLLTGAVNRTYNEDYKLLERVFSK